MMNIEVIAQTGALNTQDEFQTRIMELAVAKTFLEITIEQAYEFMPGSNDWYNSNYGRYLYKNSIETKERYDDLSLPGQQVFFTSPLVTS